MSFGDGNHRCPGNAIALLESDVFLTRLLARDLVVVSPPELTWSALIESYELRGLVVRRRWAGLHDRSGRGPEDLPPRPRLRPPARPSTPRSRAGS